MTVKMVGIDFKRFYSDPSIWGEETFHDDVLIMVDGLNATETDIDLSAVSDTAMIEIHSGEIIGALPGVPDDMADAAVWWRAKQGNVQFVVTVPKDQIDAFKAAVAGIGLESAMQEIS